MRGKGIYGSFPFSLRKRRHCLALWLLLVYNVRLGWDTHNASSEAVTLSAWHFGTRGLEGRPVRVVMGKGWWEVKPGA